jgi:hypothetical protein
MTEPAAALADPAPEQDDEAGLDLAAILHDIDVICRHRGITAAAACAEIGIAQPRLTTMRRHGAIPSAVTLAKVMRWLDPARRGYLLAEPLPPLARLGPRGRG